MSAHSWAITYFPIVFASDEQVINKVMIQHTSNEILTFCIHVGDDISTHATPAGFRFHYSIAKCEYYYILVSFICVVLGIK